MSLLKAAALCICPVVGTGVVVQTVPAARQYVHKQTAPAKSTPRPAHAFSAPGIAPCVVVGDVFGGTPVSGGFLEIVPPAAFGHGPSVGFTPGGTIYPTQPVTPPAVPEPSTWGMLITGFGLVGAAMRAQRKELKA